MQLEVKTILNKIQPFLGFVYADIRLRSLKRKLYLEITLEPHQGICGKCSVCRKPAERAMPTAPTVTSAWIMMLIALTRPPTRN